MGQPSPGEEQQFMEQFTLRETDILALLAEGMSDREIADCLVVATRTVKWYNRQWTKNKGAGQLPDSWLVTSST